MNRLLSLVLSILLTSILTTRAQTIFPADMQAPAAFNTGKVHISVLSHSEHQMTTNFLFERGSRNSWHFHPNATQVLMVLSGEAYYQEEGKPKQLLRRGDVVTTAPNVRHWNGATPWSDAECMTVSDIVPGEQHAVQLRKVTDEEFASPLSRENMIVRIAEIEVYPQYLQEYLAIAREVDRLSVEREPYQQHLKTEHFQHYKQGTLHMVKSLRLPTMQPLDPETMIKIFTKIRLHNAVYQTRQF